MHRDEVDLDQLAQLRELLLLERHDVGDAGIGDGDVEPPVALQRVLHEALEMRVVAHVAGLEGRAGLARQPPERRGVAPGRDDLGAGGAQDAHEALAEPARGAGHDRDAAIEAEHPVELGRHRAQGSGRRYRGRRDARPFDEAGALAREAADPSRRSDFRVPPWPGAAGAEWAYFAGNSLGLQPRAAAAAHRGGARGLGRARASRAGSRARGHG